MKKSFISFLENSISPNHSKLKILFDCNDFFAIEKPQDIPSQNIIHHLRSNSTQAQFSDLGISYPQKIYELDQEISGIFLISKIKSAAANLRNILGSMAINFSFDLLTFPSEFSEKTERICDLPIAKHSHENKMLISHKSGKKTNTEFFLIKKYNRCEHWSAKTTFLRPHQIRLHAHECTLDVIGENLYSQTNKSLSLIQNFKKKPADNSHWSATYLPIHLSQVSIIDDNLQYTISSPLTKKFESLINILQRRTN